MPTPKTMRDLASQITKLEGKKSEARIGDVREILGILSDLIYEEFNATPNEGDLTIVTMLIRNGRLRHDNGHKKKR